MRRSILVLTCALAALAIGPLVLAGPSRAGRPAPIPRTFVSLVPACACGRHTELDEFSIADGRRLRTLAPVVTGHYQLDTPAATRDGRLDLTYVSGVQCAANGVYAECPRYVPNSCRNVVRQLSPGQTEPRPLFTVAGSRAIVGHVVPSADGRRVALSLTPCVSVHGTTGLFVRTLATGATRAVMSSSNRCDGFGPAAWSSAGTELVFAFDRAGGRPERYAGGIACPEGRSYLAVAPLGAAPGRGVKLHAADRGCVFRSAAFDRAGIVAAEGCDRGDPEHGSGSFLGRAYLLQFGPAGTVTTRIRLRAGMEDALIAAEPGSGNLLVTEDLPANEPYPERDWVWEFDGRHLRLIASYRADDAAQILAVPW